MDSRYGELSLLYPVIGLTYVWVTGLSVIIYNETLNPWKVAEANFITRHVSEGRCCPSLANASGCE